MSDIDKEYLLKSLLDQISKDSDLVPIELELSDEDIRDKPVWNIKYKPTGATIGFFCFHEHEGSQEQERVFVPMPETFFNFTLLLRIVDLYLGLQMSDLKKGGK